VKGSVGVLGDGQGPLLQGERIGGPAEVTQGLSEVAQPEADVGVVGSVGVLGDGQGLLLQGERIGVPAEGREEATRLPSRRPTSGWSGP
jgi:hypothetical protein